MRNSIPTHPGQAPRTRARETWLGNIPGSKRVIKKVLRFDGRAIGDLTNSRHKKKPHKLSGFSEIVLGSADYSTTSTMR